MSAREPFAVADSLTDLCLGPNGCWLRVGAPDESTAEQTAQYINTAVERERRQAAADALREAADAENEMADTLTRTLYPHETGPFERNKNAATRVEIEFYRRSAQRLRLRADRVRQQMETQHD